MIRLEPRFAELAAMTNFSFLRGASHPEEMVRRAAELGLAGIGIADRNTLAGVVRAHTFARENAAAMGGARVVPGARLVFTDGAPDMLAYPKDRAAYGRLCRILTAGNLRAPKGECWLKLDDLLEHGEGLQVAVMPPTRPLPPCGGGLGRGVARTHRESLGQGKNGERGATPHPGPPPQGGRREGAHLARLREAFGPRLWIGASLTYGRDMRGELKRRMGLARAVGAPLIATNDALMHAPERRALADVLACIREKATLEDAGRLTRPTPSGISKRRAKWRGSSPRRRRPSPRRSASSTALTSASTNWRIAIRKNCARAMRRPRPRSKPSRKPARGRAIPRASRSGRARRSRTNSS